MAKLFLNFEHTTLKEFPLSLGVMSIGRLPDNDITIDNPAVSGHHAVVYWQDDQFILEDKGSFNGTYINDERVTRRVLRDGDVFLVGKHTLTFKAEPGQSVAPAHVAAAKPVLPSLDATAMLDTKKARELLAQAAAKNEARTAPAARAAEAAPAAPRVRLGMLSVVSGKTDQPSYVLTSKLTLIGKSDMASIRLKGWFAPKVAAAINRRDDRYFIAPSGAGQKITVNGQAITGQHELSGGDMITVAKLKMTFNFNDTPA